MRKNRLACLLAFGCFSCTHPRPLVYVDLDQVLSSPQDSFATPSSRVSPSRTVPLPPPPKPLPAKTYSLPAIPGQALENSSSPELLRTQADAARAQADALKTIRRRLTEIYLKQVDLFANQQTELLGDPTAKRLTELLPKLHDAFLVYAGQRLPLVTRLIFLSGFPDNNPKNNPPSANLKPVQKQKWIEANQTRTELEGMDTQYDQKAAAILAEAGALAANDRLEVLKKVDAFRRQMLDRVLEEAMNPLKSKGNLKVLHIEAAPTIILPAQEAQSIQIPATDTLPPAPRVEFQRLGENAVLSRQLLERQLIIWSSIKDYQLATRPQDKARDATKEFEQWRKQQVVGP